MRCLHSVGHNLQLNPAVNEYSLRVKHPDLYLQKLRNRGARVSALAARWESRPWRIASDDAECGRRPLRLAGDFGKPMRSGDKRNTDLDNLTRHTANSTSPGH